MIQHSDTVGLCKNRRQKRNFEQKVSTDFLRLFRHNFVCWFIFYTPAAEPLANARGTLGLCGTPIENHWCSQ